MRCPICGSTEFRDFRGRVNAQCAGCGSLERGRLVWMILQKDGLPRAGMRVLHIAPEPALMEKFSEICGSGYYPCDFEPRRFAYKGIPVFPFDMCRDPSQFPERSFDLIVHNHVLEHIRCEVGAVVTRLTELLKPGGCHVFTVPFRGRYTQEDLSDDLTDDDRVRLFAQADHMRIFGTTDFPEHLRDLDRRWDAPVDLSTMFSEDDLRDASLPTDLMVRVSGTSVFRLFSQ